LPRNMPLVRALECKTPQRTVNLTVVIMRPTSALEVAMIRQKLPENWAFEIVVYMDQPGTDRRSLMLHEELLSELPDGFVIYSNDYLGDIRPINRLVKFAAGETVLVVPGGDVVGSLRSAWIEAAAHAMVLNQHLAVIGQKGLGGFWESGMMEYKRALDASTPLMLRRSALLAVGLVDTADVCPDDPEDSAWKKFWAHLWSHGLSIAAIDRESSPSAVKRAVVPGVLAVLRPSDRTEMCTGLLTKESGRGAARGVCPGHMPDTPSAAVVVQYFSTPEHDRSIHISSIASGLRMLQREAYGGGGWS